MCGGGGGGGGGGEGGGDEVCSSVCSLAVLRQMVVHGFARFYTILEALVKFT